MPLPEEIKSANTQTSYGFDWSAYLGSFTITASQWFVSPPDLTILSNSSNSFNDTTTGVLLTGGQVGQRYLVTNRITRSDGEIDERSFTLSIQTA